MLYGRSEIPFELVIERVCKIYHKLPSEVLEEDMDWIRILIETNLYEVDRRDREEKRNNLKKK